MCRSPMWMDGGCAASRFRWRPAGSSRAPGQAPAWRPVTFDVEGVDDGGYISAFGGAEKTRFTIELARRMAARGWIAGMLPKPGRRVVRARVPRLLVLDYAETVRELRNLVEWATEDSSSP